jgi:putative redox protein
MSTEKVTAEWVRDQVFILRDRHGFPIVMAQPQGIVASDLLPLSLIGCSVYDVTSILRKQKQDIQHLEVDAFSDQDDDAPWCFRKIRIHYRVWGKDISQVAVERAIRLTEEKYCSVFATLKPALEIVSEYEILTVQQGEKADG